MSVYLYCVVPAGRVAPPANLTGVGGAAVRAIAVTQPRSDAWVSTLATLPQTVDQRARRDLGVAHDRVVSAAIESGVTPVPARAGQIFSDDAECLERLEEQAERYASALERLDGCVEMTVTVELKPEAELEAVSESPAETESGGGPGKRHLLALRARAQQGNRVRNVAVDVAAGLSSLVADLARDTAVRAHAHPRPGVAVSHLVARERSGVYRARLAGYQIGNHAAAVVTGPTAPYSFVTRSAGSTNE